MRYIAEVPAAFQRDSIRWLEMYYDTASTGGWLLRKYADLSDTWIFDTFYLDEKDARKEAEEDWGVTEDLWRAAE